MRKVTRILAVLMVLCMAVTIFAGCNNNTSSTASGNSSAGGSDVKEIYFLNFKPEISEKYDAIAKSMRKKRASRLR